MPFTALYKVAVLFLPSVSISMTIPPGPMAQSALSFAKLSVSTLKTNHMAETYELLLFLLPLVELRADDSRAAKAPDVSSLQLSMS